MTTKISLYQALKQTGKFASKTEILQAISSKRVTINGIQTTAAKFQFSPNKKIVCIDGKPISFVGKRYFILNKPAGYSCQKNDQFPYVGELVKADEETKNALFPIGRLDVPTTGLLVLTNDGALSSLLAEPRRKVTKTYNALLKHRITEEQINGLRDGVFILVDGKKYKTQPAFVQKKDENNIEITITEGKYRQIRKMFEAVGNKVVALQRIAIGQLHLGNLREREYKEYREQELKKTIFG